MPKPGQMCPVTGLRYGQLRKLCIPCRENNYNPPVPARLVDPEQKGTRGSVLVARAELIEYLNSRPPPGVKPRLLPNNIMHYRLQDVACCADVWADMINPDLEIEFDTLSEWKAMGEAERLALLRQWGYVDRL